MICIKCGRDIRDDAVFCPKCGSKQEVQIRKTQKHKTRTGRVVLIIIMIVVFTAVITSVFFETNILSCADDIPTGGNMSNTGIPVSQGAENPRETQNTPATGTTLFSLQSRGEIDGFIRGYTLHIVYKTIEATFNEQAYVKVGIVDDECNYIVQLTSGSNEALDRIAYAIQSNFLVRHIGDDFFLSDNYGGVSIYNARTDIAFTVYKEKSVPNTSGIYDEIDVNPLLSGFSEGVVITTTKRIGRSYGPGPSTSYGGSWITIIHQDGTMVDTNISGNFTAWEQVNASVGRRSYGQLKEGLFWAYGSFYDIDGRMVINLSELVIDNKPEFYNGEAYLIILRNGKQWETHIDMQGNFRYEPKEIG